MNQPQHHSLNPAFSRHDRSWRRNCYVYPVCSRRAGGISIGVNLNPRRDCTFNCVYCQVGRKRTRGRGDTGARRTIDLAVLRAELDEMLAAAADGKLLAEPEFANLPADLRRVNDVAFSGDGEPTACPRFAGAVALADDLIVAAGLNLTRVVITNASLLHRPGVRVAVEVLHRIRGELWAKLDAGSESYFRRIGRTSVPFGRIIDNLSWAAHRWPIVIQSCFIRLDGDGPAGEEIAAYCDRLAEILADGGRIKLVQVYTVARPPAERFVAPLPRAQVDAIVRTISARLPAVAVKAFYGPE